MAWESNPQTRTTDASTDSLPCQIGPIRSKFLATDLCGDGAGISGSGLRLLSQAMEGYFRFGLGSIAKEIYLIYLPQMLMVILLALCFCRRFLGNKFVAHAIVVDSLS